MKHVKRGGVFLALLAALFAAVLCAAPTQALATTRTITLDPCDGSVSQTSIEVNDDVLPSLPTPTRTGWTFAGWYTKKPNYETYENTQWIGYTNGGELVHENMRVPNVDTLYAFYKAERYEVKCYYNGWANKWGAFIVHRDYGLPITEILNYGDYPGHTLLGWSTSSTANGPIFDLDSGVTSNFNLYAQYTGMAENPSSVHDRMVSAWGIKLSPSSASVDPNGGTTTITASLNMMNSVVNPTSTDWEHVTWDVTEGRNLVSLSGSGSSRTVKATADSGTATIKVSFINEKGNTVSATATVTIKSHVHTWGKEQMLVSPTCSKYGIGKVTCTGCGEVKQIEHEPIPHTYKTITEAATCTKDGSEKSVCTMCGKTESTKTLPKTGHDFETKTLKETCVGTAMQKTCKNCGFIETYESGTAGKNHSWSDEWTVDKQPTCGTPGSKSHHCTACGMTKDSTEIPATGNHVFGGWHTTKVAKPDVKGEQERMCEICHAVETKELPALVGGESEPAAPDDQVTAPDESQKDDSQEDSEGTTGTDTEETTGKDSEETTGEDSETNPGTTNPDQQQPSGQQPVEIDKDTSNVRVYNPNNGEHLYVKSNEAADLEARGWTVEQSHVTAAYSSTPVYRLYNQWSGEHHYTTSLNEVNTLKEFGWTVDFDGKPAFYSDDDQAVKVYRLWNGQQGAGSHHYTTSIDEYNDCIAQGWQDEGTGWYYVA